ncbi:hypothetical protein [Clostridium thermarum]|uniref:hypothetical protein n=1 Tax=Clostridium thermarum TaxID=1716543 RepID=UPI0011242B23|nr:hypothetical protein [Clostridium thermarum]
MEAVIILLFATVAVLISVTQDKNHERKIEDKIKELGGQVIEIKREKYSTGPYTIIARGKIVYRIKYKIGSEIKEGWVKFGDLFGPDWRL